MNILGGHSIGHSKQKKCIYTYILFRTVSGVELFHCTVPKLLIREIYYVLFLIPVFIVQVTKLVQLASIVNINALCNSCGDMACCSSVQCTVYCTVK
jgi:hypothetical protein